MNDLGHLPAYDAGYATPNNGILRTELYNSTSVTVNANAGNEPKIPFDTVIIDSLHAFDSVNNRIVIAAGGIYRVYIRVYYQSVGGGRFIAYLIKNGNTGSAINAQEYYNGATGADAVIQFLCTHVLNAGDYLEVYTLQTDSSNRTIQASTPTAQTQSRFGIERLF